MWGLDSIHYYYVGFIYEKHVDKCVQTLDFCNRVFSSLDGCFVNFFWYLRIVRIVFLTSYICCILMLFCSLQCLLFLTIYLIYPLFDTRFNSN